MAGIPTDCRNLDFWAGTECSLELQRRKYMLIGGAVGEKRDNLVGELTY